MMFCLDSCAAHVSCALSLRFEGRGTKVFGGGPDWRRRRGIDSDVEPQLSAVNGSRKSEVNGNAKRSVIGANEV